jgi:hypothetical protein
MELMIINNIVLTTGINATRIAHNCIISLGYAPTHHSVLQKSLVYFQKSEYFSKYISRSV